MKKDFKKIAFVFCCTLCVIAAVGFYSDMNLFGSDSREAMELVSEKALIPGGQSVGIKMDVKGVLVVGLEEVETEDKIVSPGYDAGIQIGDIILAINGEEVQYAYQVSDILKRMGDEATEDKMDVSVLISRNDENEIYTVKAVKDFETKEYKLGIWVKEKIAGIGTLTFYDQEENIYGCLGHGIYERKTKTLLEAGKGELLRTKVKSIKEGETGDPGEIRGIFYQEEQPIGNVYKNSEFGVFSRGIDGNSDKFMTSEAMVVATKEQIKIGKAYILTTINGSNVENFDIEITKINKQDEIDTKGLEIKVTDKKLLSYSGGIVQGMSGSPIIQDGRIVGAVTHVLVNDPTRGYGIFIENMLDAAS